jgi:dihydrofolate reductase/thymidylate synthase
MASNITENNTNNEYIYSLIVAHTVPEFAIGKEGTIPWYIPEDLQHFKNITTSKQNNSSSKMNIVIMGRKTWDSIPDKVKPLSNRFTIIITRNEELLRSNDLTNNLQILYCTWERLSSELNKLKTNPILSNYVYFAGGQEIYNMALHDYPISRSYITEIYYNTKKNLDMFDVFFPKYKMHNWLVPCYENNTNNPDNIVNSYNKLFLFTVSKIHSYFDKRLKKMLYYRFKEYYTANVLNSNNKDKWLTTSAENTQYISIMKQIMNEGIERDDRTGTGTLSLFGTRQHYKLTDTFPLSTTKRIFFRAVFEELKLYLSGCTDNAILQEKGIHIWDGNTSREFLDNRGLINYPEGDMGETYGFNFRHFGGEYKDCHTKYPLDGSNGYDQLANVIHLLKNDPTSRRIIINLWNPATLHKASLPSCLMMYQFYVDTHAKLLHCQIYIRSSDYFLANNWNTCTGALLVHMLCSLEDIDLTPGSITTITGDTHIYKTHLEQVNQNLEREPVPFPKLVIENNKSQTKKFKKLEDIEFEDLKLYGYMPQPNISAPMAV